MTQPEMGELLKLGEAAPAMQNVSSVINWIRANGMNICRYSDYDEEWEPVYTSSERLAAQFCGIDLDLAQRQEIAWRDWNMGLDEIGVDE